MKKLFLFAGLCLIASAVNAQTLTAAGTVVDSHNSTIGYYKGDGTVEDSHHSTIGYIKSDGTIEDSHHSTIGYLKSDGTIEDSHHSTVGHADGNKTQAVLRKFFFKS
jgi:hypothetical protein